MSSQSACHATPHWFSKIRQWGQSWRKVPAHQAASQTVGLEDTPHVSGLDDIFPGPVSDVFSELTGASPAPKADKSPACELSESVPVSASVVSKSSRAGFSDRLRRQVCWPTASRDITSSEDCEAALALTETEPDEPAACPAETEHTMQLVWVRPDSHLTLGGDCRILAQNHRLLNTRINRLVNGYFSQVAS